MSPVKAASPSLSEVIRGQLKSDILRGTLPPGTQLRQENLAERFKASRIPVREALRQLQVEGLVSYERNHSAIVIAMSTEDVCELLDIRIALETYAARIAVPNMGAADIAQLTRILDACDLRGTVEEWADCNRAFHLALCAPANNRRLKQMIEEYCTNTTNRYPYLRMSVDTDIEVVQRDHYAIVDACRERDADKVAALVEQHIQETRRDVLAVARTASTRVAR